MTTTPNDRRYHPDHIWAVAEKAEVRIGVTDYAQEQLSEVVYVGLPEPGTSIEQGEPFGEIESTKTLNDLISPVSGTIRARNEELLANPALVNTDPYGQGWMVVATLDGTRQLENLLSANQYDERTSGSEG